MGEKYLKYRAQYGKHWDNAEKQGPNLDRWLRVRAKISITGCSSPPPKALSHVPVRSGLKLTDNDQITRELESCRDRYLINNSSSLMNIPLIIDHNT